MNDYRNKTDEELRYIIFDAGTAARNMRNFNPVAEGKYLDQVHDAHAELMRREKTIRKDYVVKVQHRDTGAIETLLVSVANAGKVRGHVISTRGDAWKVIACQPV